MQDYKSLKIWEKGHMLALKVYKVTATFPKEEMYALVSQMRRAAYSVPMNIVEGCGRKSKKEFGRFLDIAYASAKELEYQCLLSKDLKYIGLKRYDDLTSDISEVQKMMGAFIRRQAT